MAKKRCDGKQMWPWCRSRNVYLSGGEQRSGSMDPDHGFRDGNPGQTGAEATAQRSLYWVTPDDARLFQCGNGRWHERDGKPLSAICDWGVMPYYDARVAHEVARRIRYRIPQRWEWIVMGGIAVAEAMRLALGDEGLLSVLGLH